MGAKIEYSELETAFMWASMDGSVDAVAYIDEETGKVYLVSEEVTDNEEEWPEDLEDNPRYLVVPDKRELNLGRALALRFAEEHMPAFEGFVNECFRRAGAYARFKDLLERERKLEAWYAYEEAAQKAALRRWAEEQGLEVVFGGADGEISTSDEDP